MVNLEGEGRPGEFLEVEIVEATPHSLIGKGVKEAAQPAEEQGRSAVTGSLEDPLRVL